MASKIIVSYDGTANEDDALALGGLFARAGAEVALAYVRHNQETVSDAEGKELLARGAKLFGNPAVDTFVVNSTSTPEGLAALAEDQGAEMIVFCSDSHTAKGHIGVGNSAQRLIEGGSTAVAVAPADFAETSPDQALGTVVAVSDGDGGARETADSLAAALGATWRRSSTTTRASWYSTRARKPSPARSRSAPRPGTWWTSPAARCWCSRAATRSPSAGAPPLRTPPSGLPRTPYGCPARDPALGARPLALDAPPARPPLPGAA